MKKVILLALLMPFPAFGQIIENFEQGTIVNWTQSTEGRWKADTTLSLSGKFSLHHSFDNPAEGIDQTGIRINDLHPSQGTTRWSFLIKYGYDPSSLNNWAVFLMSDNSPAGMAPGTTKGFALGVNLVGSDDSLRIWKINGSTVSVAVNCGLNWQEDIGTGTVVKIVVERSKEGQWLVSVYGVTGILMRSSTGSESELFSQQWFGIYYRYSATRDRMLWLDDINIAGNFDADTEAPLIVESKVSGRNRVEIRLDEEPSGEIMVPENFSLKNVQNKAEAIIKKSNLIYEIEFDHSFINGSVNYLIVKKLCDPSGNCSNEINSAFTSSWAEAGDVIISEIMADPLPEISLPGKEYIEITNRTTRTINLKNWKLSTETQTALFPEATIPPSGIMILCMPADTLLFNKFGHVTGIKQFPSLTDGGRIIYISDSTGMFIHGVEYSPAWYKDDLKSDGGWSMEMVDTRYPFYGEENWKASCSKKGGSPGTVNSVSENNKDLSFYGLLNAFPADSLTLQILFSEPVFSLSGNPEAIKIEDNIVVGVTARDPLFREFSLILKEPLSKRKIIHLQISKGLADFAGNMIENYEFDFGLTEPAGKSDILFNELLFNPLPGDQDYLELFNSSDKIIDASRLKLVFVSDVSGQAVPVSEIGRCILPGGYYALTTDKKRISERYFSTDGEHLFETASLPSMPDDKGHLVLYSRELDLIDEVIYNDDMQNSLLSSCEGVALEKTDPRTSSEERSRWRSASESSGYGTPGAVNSIYREMPANSGKVTFSSSKITPDNDGNEDFLTIKLNFEGNSDVVSLTIYDETGNFVRKIAANLLAGPEASLIWDGTGADGSMVTTGIYIILITSYNDTGKTEKWKKVCTVIR